MRDGTLPTLPPMRPWFGAGEVAERILPATRRYAPRLKVDPPRPEGYDSMPLVRTPVGMNGEFEPQLSNGFDPMRLAGRQGLPRLSETSLIRAHRHCPCERHEELHSLAEWDEIERRQRAFVADPEAVAREAQEIERAMQR